MFRRIVLAAVTTTGIASGFALTPTAAEAHPPAYCAPPVVAYRAPRRVEFEVMYRRGHHWHVAGTYCERGEANRVAESFRCRGYFVEVRPV